jgi:hypothetical protein
MLSVPLSRPRQCGLGTLWLVVHLRLRLRLRLLPLLLLPLLPLLLLLLLLLLLPLPLPLPLLLLPPLLPLLLPELLFDTALHLPFRWPSPTLSRRPPCGLPPSSDACLSLSPRPPPVSRLRPSRRPSW